MAYRDHNEIVRKVRQHGYRMTRAERSAFVQDIKSKSDYMLWHRDDKRHRSLYGWGECVRPVAFAVDVNDLRVFQFRGVLFLAQDLDVFS